MTHKPVNQNDASLPGVPAQEVKSPGHVPVLCHEVIDALLGCRSPQDISSGERHLFVDCTLGGGGHSQAIIDSYRQRYGQAALLERFALIGIDQDAAILAQTRQLLQEKHPELAMHFHHGNFSELSQILPNAGYAEQAITGGVLADIGVSSFQFDQAERGFSFNKDAPLDMRMDQSQALTAADVLNTYGEKELVRIFSEYGEERFSKTIARLVCQRRNESAFVRTLDFSTLVKTLYQQKLPPKAYKIHPATKVFQALRIEVNRELAVLESLLQGLPDVLSPGARACVISFHSLEDRIVKNAFRNLYQNDGPLLLVTRKPLCATPEEIEKNPRARSAKLRVAERR